MNNPYLTAKMVGRFFVASMLSLMIYQINGIADGIIVSHAVTPDAISAIGLSAPITTIIFLLAEVLCNGGSIIAAKYIGSQNYKDAGRMYSVCFMSMLFIYTLIAVITVMFSKQIADLLTEEQRLRVLLYDYLPVSFVSVCILSVTTVFFKFIACAGRPDLVTKSLVLMCVSNIILDIIFVVVFKWGINGAAWATLISGVISNAVYIKFYTDKNCIYKMTMPKREWFGGLFASAFSMGVPTGLGSLSGAILTGVLNAVALKFAGADGLFVLTVGLQMMLVCFLVLDGTSGAISSIGGLLLGEKDIDGYRRMVVNTRKLSILVVCLLTLLMMAFPDMIVRIFGATDQLIEYSRTPLREFCLLFIPYCALMLFSVGFQVQGHKFMSSVIMVGKLVSILCAVAITLKVCPQYVWLSGFFGLFALQMIMFTIMWPLAKLHPNLHPLTLIDKHSEYQCLIESVTYTTDSVYTMMAKAQDFLNNCNLTPLMVNNIKQCIEKMSFNIVDVACSTNKKGFFDVRIVDERDGILVVIKDECCKEGYTNLPIINELCHNIKYQYLNGVNCTYMKFNNN